MMISQTRRIDRDLITTGEPLSVTVCLVERDPLDAERRQRSFGVPLRDRERPKLTPVGLQAVNLPNSNGSDLLIGFFRLSLGQCASCEILFGERITDLLITY
jgi:hypothetical protein